jgi:hypothetical protein
MRSDPPQHCAQTLLDFNGGASCVQAYVNQHDFFINRVQKDMESDDPVLSVSRDGVVWLGTDAQSGGAPWLTLIRYHQRTSQV